ncbi:AraC family transcriptional regulator [Amnibacterium setariae]|uniref:AraC family transcriptional regulator n=1 Tax=Amnibacterium setariae TaxID=2306585 RepID=A0A3A1U6I4_9MICO|nr:AraC family transcriptional regulator [Amnibacterium setariae]RIX28544.1 AraC family transcriptional regulator [Amnibacterium setariae]
MTTATAALPIRSSRPTRATAGTVGADALRALPSTLLRETTDALGPQVALREFVDPLRTAFVLPPSDALAVIVVTRGHYVLQTGPARARAHALMSPGASSVTRPGREIHAAWRTSAPVDLRSLHLHVSRALLDRTAEELGSPSTEGPDWLRRGDPFVSTVLRQLAADVRAAAPRLHLDTLVQALLHHLIAQDRPDPRATPPLGARALAEVVDLMQAHAEDPLTLERLAEVAHLSPQHFLRRFAAATGSTPVRYLTRIRMERAAELLLDDALAVQDVALRCGYADHSAFSAAFRRFWGRSPSEHRRGAGS